MWLGLGVYTYGGTPDLIYGALPPPVAGAALSNFSSHHVRSAYGGETDALSGPKLDVNLGLEITYLELFHPQPEALRLLHFWDAFNDETVRKYASWINN